MIKFLKVALRIAGDSNNTWKHGAVLVKSGSVIATAPNIYKNNPMIFENAFPDDFAAQQNLIRDHCSVHAEARVVKIAGDSARGSVVYVARVNNHGKPLMSRPCDHCYKILTAAGVKSVVYTTS